MESNIVHRQVQIQVRAGVGRLFQGSSIANEVEGPSAPAKGNGQFSPIWDRVEVSNTTCLRERQLKKKMNSPFPLWGRKSSRETGEEMWQAPGHSQVFLPQHWGGTELNRSVICMVLNARDNDRRKNVSLSPTRGLLATDHVILNHGEVTWTTPELAPPSPNYHTTPTGGRFSS
ncbi:hypothetical protein TNCV_2000381 [Trichonephila clavipes]|nr:hypothetical protein TNCV_2000381 [Trichonephila clavipes]